MFALHHKLAAAEIDPLYCSTSAVLLQVAHFNDEIAVVNMTNNNLPAARQPFVKLLRDLRDLCKAGVHHEHQDGDRRFRDFEPTSSKSVKRSFFPRCMSVAHAHRQQDATRQECDIALFEKAILLQGSDVKFDVNSCAAVVLYNTGLLHHTQGLITGCADSFRSAVSFYKQVLAVLAQQQELLGESSTLLLVACATLYNLSHCLMSAFAETGKAKCYAEQLERLLEWAFSMSGSRLAPSDMEFFYSSLLFTKMCMRNCKAAAAA